MEKFGLAPGYFLFVGTLQPRKNVERIVAAYKSLPSELQEERHLVIAGQAGWGSASLLTQIQSLQQEGKCSWLKYVAAEDLKTLYQCAGAFVFPSLWEGFGIPVLEAFASRVPVITSNLSSLPEVAGDAAILIDPYSVSDLREA
jgi:alpha-1,3-rhamnosyl/mannosyltransferase